MENLKTSFASKKYPQYLHEAESKSEVKKAILPTSVRQYNDIEVRLVSNMKNIYGIIWGQCTPGLKSVLKVNKDFLNTSTLFDSL